MTDLPSIVGLIASVFAVTGCIVGYLIGTRGVRQEMESAWEQGRQLGFQEGCKRIERYHNSKR
jgi:hypothetical protein